MTLTLLATPPSPAGAELPSLPQTGEQGLHTEHLALALGSALHPTVEGQCLYGVYGATFSPQPQSGGLRLLGKGTIELPTGSEVSQDAA